MTSDTPYTSEDDVVDVLPEDLDPQAFAGAYKFPDNSRRRIPAAMYVVLGVGAIVGSVADRSSVNGGVLAAGIGLLTFGAFGVYSGRKMSVDEPLPSLHLNKRLGSRLGMHRHSKCGEGWAVDRRGECWPTQERFRHGGGHWCLLTP